MDYCASWDFMLKGSLYSGIDWWTGMECYGAKQRDVKTVREWKTTFLRLEINNITLQYLLLSSISEKENCRYPDDNVLTHGSIC